MICTKCELVKMISNLLECDQAIMIKKLRAPQLKPLLSAPWATSRDNSYYGDPRHVNKEQHGLEDIERDQVEEDGVEQVVILGYN